MSFVLIALVVVVIALEVKLMADVTKLKSQVDVTLQVETTILSILEGVSTSTDQVQIDAEVARLASSNALVQAAIDKFNTPV